MAAWWGSPEERKQTWQDVGTALNPEQFGTKRRGRAVDRLGFGDDEIIKSGPYKGMTKKEKDAAIDAKVKKTKAQKKKDQELETAVNEYMGSLKDAPDHELYKNWNIRNRKPGQVLPGDYKSMLPQGGRGMSEGQLRVARGKMGLEDTYPARDERYEDLMRRNRESMRQPTQNPQMISSPEKGPAPAPVAAPAPTPEIKKPSTRQIAQQSQQINQQINKSGIRAQGKQAVAQAKEQMGRYYVDPQTGYALNLDRLDKAINRKRSMKLAALLPPALRASFLASDSGGNVIDKADIPVDPEVELKKRLYEIQIANATLKLENEKNKMSPQEAKYFDIAKTAISSQNYYLASTMLEKAGVKDIDIEKIIENDGRYKASLLKKNGMSKGMENLTGFKPNQISSMRSEVLRDWRTRDNPVSGEASKRSLLLKTYGLPDSEGEGAPDFTQMVDMGNGKKMSQFKASLLSRAADPSQAPVYAQQLAFAASKIPDDTSRWTPEDYEAWLTDSVVYLEMHQRVKNYDQYLRAEAGVVADENGKTLSGTKSEEINDVNKLETNKTTDASAPRKDPKVVKEPAPKKEETSNWQGDFVNVSGNATNILNQAKAQGYPGGTVREFISDLNESTKGNYTAKSLPAKMPKFWGKSSSSEGQLSKKLKESTIKEAEETAKKQARDTNVSQDKLLKKKYESGKNKVLRAIKEEIKEANDPTYRAGQIKGIGSSRAKLAGREPRWTDIKSYVKWLKDNNEFNDLGDDVKYYLSQIE